MTRIYAAAIGTERPTPSRRSRPALQLPGALSLHRRESAGDAPPLHRAAPRRAPARQAGEVHADRGLRLRHRALRHLRPQGLRAHARHAARRDEGRDAARRRAARHARRLRGEGYDDVEGDILEKARKIVGDKCVIGVELDPHCHLTKKRVSLADIIILYKEYPHVDFMPRAEELLTIVLKTIRGEIRPVASLYDCRMIAFFPTTMEPTRSFVDRMSALEGARRRALRLARPRLPACRRAGDGHARARLHRQRPEGRRRAGDAAGQGDRLPARQDLAEAPQRVERAEGGRRDRHAERPRGDRRARRQRRRRLGLRHTRSGFRR